MISLVFGVSLSQGYTEHGTFKKKTGTYETNIKLFDIGDISTNFSTGSTFGAKKWLKSV